MLAAALGMFFPAVERGGKNGFQPFGLSLRMRLCLFLRQGSGLLVSPVAFECSM